MAVRTVDRTKTASGWNNKTFWPKDNYILRCIDAEVGVSSTDNPMVTLEWEVVNCDPKQIGDKLVDFEGAKFKSHHVTRVEGDEQKSQSMFNRYAEILEKCGIDTSEGFDDENPPTPKGKVVHACVYGKEQPSLASPTPEERAKGKKVGEPIKDPITNKPVITYQPQIETIYGLFDGEVRNPF